MSNIGSSYIALQSMGTMVVGVVITIVGITGAYLAKETKNKLIWGCVGAAGVAIYWGSSKIKSHAQENPESVGKYGLILLSLFVLGRVVTIFRPLNSSSSNVAQEEATSQDNSDDTNSEPVVEVPDLGPIPLPDASKHEILPINPSENIPRNSIMSQGNLMLIP